VCDCRYGYGRLWALTTYSQCHTRKLGLAVSRFVTGRQLSLVQETSCTLYRSEMEHAEATSRNETRALPENNFVIARLVISFSARILCNIISLVLKSLCFYWFMR
jgi:hypothetical protein